MRTVRNYVRRLQERGQHTFSVEDVVQAMDGHRHSVVRALNRLKAKGELATPQRGFYVIVTPEYRSLGCLPAEQFIPQLMQRSAEPYHVALLSAAQFHGAAHHRPQRFQVMLRVPRASIECGRVRVDFHVRGDLERAATSTVNTPRGHVRVSSPETTALELIGYVRHAGGLHNVATVLADLVESIRPDRLVEEARKLPVAWSQRLGFLLDLVDAADAAQSLNGYVQGHARRIAPLDASSSRTGAERSGRWRLAINADLEIDR